MTRPTAKAVGERGSWFATVLGERLPCVHAYLISGTQHRALRVSQQSTKDMELVRAIKLLNKVVVTKDKVEGDGIGFERTGYVAVFAVKDVKLEGGELTFELTERLVDLR